MKIDQDQLVIFISQSVTTAVCTLLQLLKLVKTSKISINFRDHFFDTTSGCNITDFRYFVYSTVFLVTLSVSNKLLHAVLNF